MTILTLLVTFTFSLPTLPYFVDSLFWGCFDKTNFDVSEQILNHLKPVS
jgi:hypothetical protein